MINFMKKMIGKSNKKNNHATDREALKREVQKGSEEAIKRYKGVLKRLAEYDRV